MSSQVPTFIVTRTFFRVAHAMKIQNIDLEDVLKTNKSRKSNVTAVFYENQKCRVDDCDSYKTLKRNTLDTRPESSFNGSEIRIMLGIPIPLLLVSRVRYLYSFRLFVYTRFLLFFFFSLVRFVIAIRIL